MLDKLPSELVIEIIIKYPRLDMINLAYTNKNNNHIYWNSILYNRRPFRLTRINSLLELYLYYLTPKIDIVIYGKLSRQLVIDSYRFLNKKIKVCKECDIKICERGNIRVNSSILFF